MALIIARFTTGSMRGVLARSVATSVSFSSWPAIVQSMAVPKAHFAAGSIRGVLARAFQSNLHGLILLSSDSSVQSRSKCSIDSRFNHWFDRTFGSSCNKRFNTDHLNISLGTTY
ncbi:hypothetical protein FB192DRAFT_1062245 [Mucor lusitanicus]|uniref:Uncharacterized protein n=1 Tax=Mucor circinelloides f. lusitanicus TaxID=29924 RepID=A0A8H4BN80_MUCCL|nr:hypothetical protein FB192DRAFT_1062245 [Mucor lusitanicus]